MISMNTFTPSILNIYEGVIYDTNKREINISCYRDMLYTRKYLYEKV